MSMHGNKGTHNRAIEALRAFSLVEILISIIILGLGLLGLGALFPVVIRQQRASTDLTLGVIVGESARAKLAAGVFTMEWPDVQATPTARNSVTNTPDPLGGSNSWTLLGTFLPPKIPLNSASGTRAAPWGLGEGYNWNQYYDDINLTPQKYEHGEWLVDMTISPNDRRINTGLVRGAIALGDPRNADFQNPIPLADRLYPAESETPQFAWDIAVQRVSDGVLGSAPNHDSLRAAIFVRRIDQRIRVPKGATLRQTLLAEGGVNPSDQRSPFGEEPSQQQPTLDGTDGAGGYAYSQVKSATVQFIHQPGVGTLEGRDRLYVPPPGGPGGVADNVFALMRQPNQKLIDNLGNIYTVISSGVDETLNQRYLKIEPPIQASITERHDENASDTDLIAIREVAFTAQIPVYVTTLEVAK